MHCHQHTNPFQSHLEGSFGNVEISTVQDNALGVVKHKHVDNSAAGEDHIVQVRVQGEVIAERTYAMRQPEQCPGKEFTICGHGVDWLKGRLTTTCLRDGGLGPAREMGMRDKLTR